MNKFRCFKRTKLAAAILIATCPALAIIPAPLWAQNETVIEEIIVTATRRSASIQDVPINITAVTSDLIEDLRLYDLSEISKMVPGLHVVDQDPWDNSTDLLVRGLNTDLLGPSYVFKGGVVATYLGEIPLAVDLKTNDLARVEVLLGPQGTLYGAGTLGGAIRYIPNKPENQFSADLHTSISAMDHSAGISHNSGFVINLPIVDEKLALRASVNYLKDQGFIDYAFVIRTPGVSNPQPDFNDPADVDANLRRVEDANGEETWSGRLGLRWTPNEKIDATLWYYLQNVEVEGRSVAHQDSIGSGPYESGLRYLEPNDYDNELIALEITADLGFAELTSATGVSDFVQVGQVDQTDLYLGFEYGYEFFPAFSAFSGESGGEETFTQELRLVSTSDGPVSWIAGYFYHNLDRHFTLEEFAPGFDDFAVAAFGGVQLRPDELVYTDFSDKDLTENAFFGELSWAFNNAWQATVGFRRYEFKVDQTIGFDIPLFRTVFLGDPPDSISFILASNDVQDDGTLFKFNLSHDINEDLLAYFTWSEGYRVGGINAVPPCSESDLGMPGQNICGLPHEILIEPDTTQNFELGLRSSWLNNSLIVNGDFYFIQWDKIQIGSVTENGSLPITVNGAKAETKGLELGMQWAMNDHWSVSANYAYTHAVITQDTDGLVRDFDGPLTVLSGTRLPGSPEHQGAINLAYTDTVFDHVDMNLRWSLSAVSDIFNVVGGDEQPELRSLGAESIPGYGINNLSAAFSRGNWQATLFVDNVFDKYAITGTYLVRGFLYTVNGFNLRVYGQHVARPRSIGVALRYSF